jgi:hypothetical protein
MVVATDDNLRDPYGPFSWADTLEAEAPEHRLFNLLPCPWQCEQSWLPLIDGTMIACPSCNGDNDGN